MRRARAKSESDASATERDPAAVDLGNNLRRERARLEMTARAAAAAINRQPQAVFRWEWGDQAPSFKDLCGLARLYGVPLSRLFKNVRV